MAHAISLSREGAYNKEHETTGETEEGGLMAAPRITLTLGTGLFLSGAAYCAELKCDG